MANVSYLSGGDQPVMSSNEKDIKGTASPDYDSSDGQIVSGRGYERPNFWTRMGVTPDSFRRRTLNDKHNQLNQTMKKRHLNMIAIGGSIGAGLFAGSGGALANGGPAALLICFAIIGVMMFNVVYALGELAILYPISGGFYTYSTRFIDPSWGFAMGWNYVLQWAVVLPLEITVAGLTVAYWEVDLNNAVWITIFWAVIVFICVFGVLGYAEEEFWCSLLKLTTIVIFLFIGLIFVCGGGPSNGRYDEYIGGRYWQDPGAFAAGFPGVCAVFVTAAFSFSGTELVGLAAAESENPQKALPSAVKQVFWRITLFYILSLTFVGLLVPHTDERLIGSGFITVKASPFVIVAEYGGIPAFADFVNVVILCSVISIGLSGVYGGSRTLTALAEQGYAPKVFRYVDRAGRPLWSTVVILACSPLAYITLASTGETVFNWLLQLSGLAALFTWGSICLAHIRFRAAWKYQGHTLDELPFRSVFGVGGSWVGFLLCILVLIAQGYTAIKGSVEGNTAEPFFYNLLACFVVVPFYIAGYFWKKKQFPNSPPGWLKLSQIDVDSGRRELDYEAFEKYRNFMQTAPTWRRFLSYLF